MDPSSPLLPTDDHLDVYEDHDDDSYYPEDDDIFDDNEYSKDYGNDVVVEHPYDDHHMDVSSSDYTYLNGFDQYYRAFPFSSEKSHLEPGNKVILPLSAFNTLMSIGVGFPMLFRIENPSTRKTSHCGVLEFSAEEGSAFIPTWLMKNLSLENGELVKFKNVTLDRANYIKLQPHSVDFLNIQNPKEALEASFCGGYSCLTVGDTIMIMNEGKKFFIDVIDAKPSTAVCVIETDCEVDFSPPLDYKEPSKKVRVVEEDIDLSKKFVPFCGRARKVNEEEGNYNNGKDYKEPSKNVRAVEEDEDLSKKLVPFCGRARKLNEEECNYNHGEESKKRDKVTTTSTISKKGSKSRCECDHEATKEQKSFAPFTGKKYTLQDL